MGADSHKKKGDTFRYEIKPNALKKEMTDGRCSSHKGQLKRNSRDFAEEIKSVRVILKYALANEVSKPSRRCAYLRFNPARLDIIRA